jgi:hypothetical protein
MGRKKKRTLAERFPNLAKGSPDADVIEDDSHRRIEPTEDELAFLAIRRKEFAEEKKRQGMGLSSPPIEELGTPAQPQPDFTVPREANGGAADVRSNAAVHRGWESESRSATNKNPRPLTRLAQKATTFRPPKSCSTHRTRHSRLSRASVAAQSRFGREFLFPIPSLESGSSARTTCKCFPYR